MRIIGGALKGKLIQPPAGYKARPTTDFAREGLFNVLNNEYEFEDLKVLDLFGGTGAISFEFASRGAARVYSVEMARENATFIKREADRLGLSNVTSCRYAGKNSTWFLPTRPMPWKDWKPCPTRSCPALSCIPAAILSWSTATSIALPPIPPS